MRAVFVDTGGVLEFTSETGWVEKWEFRLGLDPGDLARIVSPIWQPGRTGAASLAEIEEQTAEALHVDRDLAHELWDDMWAWYVGTPNDDLVEYLASLRPRYQLAIVSNSFVGAREREETLYGFAGIFEAIIYSHEEGLEKPDPAIYLLACERLRVRPEDVVFVDDTEGHVAAAERIGMRGVVFRDNRSAIPEIQRHLDKDRSNR